MSPSLTSGPFTRAAALVAAITVTAVIIDVMAEIGHPPPNGFTVLNMLTPPASVLAMVGITPAVAQGSQVAAPGLHVHAFAEP